MEKTISFETSKQIQSVIKDMETEYGYTSNGYLHRFKSSQSRCPNCSQIDHNLIYKTLTTDEAIDIIYILNGKAREYVNYKISEQSWDSVSALEIVDLDFIEAILLYLYDNDLLK